MVFAPVQWLVQLVSWLPAFLRPGIFLGLVLLILWFVFIQRGLPDLWHALCRATARLIDAVVGILLLPDYLITSARQRQNEEPAQAMLAMGGVAERLLDGAGSLYQRHLRPPIQWKKLPGLPLLAIVVVFTLPWAVMELVSPSSAVRQELAQGYDVWRDVEDWADVDASRRAAPGVSWSPRPQLLSSRRHGRRVGVTVRCRRQDRCAGRIVLRSGKGARLHSRLVAVKPETTATVHMRLSRADAGTNHVLVRIARANPG